MGAAQSAHAPSFQSRAVGVGQAEDEDARPFVRRADFSRRVDSRLNPETHFAKLSDDQIEPQGYVTEDVLEEDGPGLHLSDDSGDVGPEVPGIVGAEALAGEGEGLARVAANDEIHDSTPGSSVKGSQIRPNRRVIQPPFLHPFSQDFAGIGFDLDSADRSSISERQMDAEVESPGSGRQRQHVAGLIHIQLPFSSSSSRSRRHISPPLLKS